MVCPANVTTLVLLKNCDNDNDDNNNEDNNNEDSKDKDNEGKIIGFKDGLPCQCHHISPPTKP